jgi:hypothetical protein
MDARRIGGIRADSSPCVVESQGFSRGKAVKRCSPGVGYDDRAFWDEIPIVPIVLPDTMISVVNHTSLLNERCTYAVRASW